MTRVTAGRAILLFGATVLGACAGNDDDDDVASTFPPFTMTDVTAASGLDFTTTSGRTPATQIVEVKGGGLALLDYDNDGDLDLFVPNGAMLETPESGPGCRLFENVTTRGGQFEFRDSTAAAGLELTRWAMGVAVGDVDGDGHEDLYVACFGPDVLLRNLGDGRFADITADAGIDVDGWSTGCSFGDVDADGDLDLYVARYIDFDPTQPPAPSSFRGTPVFAGPRGLPAAGDVLLENTGGGRFRDVTAETGVGTVPASYGLGVVILDLDDDGRADIFVGNDSEPNFLFRNRTTAGGPLRFDETGVASGLATSGDGSSRATMGIAVGDVDGDGRPDLFTTNFAGEPNTLHLGRAGGFHDDASRRFGVGMTALRWLGWATAFVDFDQDGAEDLIVFNGHVYPMATPETMFSGVDQTPLLMKREGPRFVRVGPEEAGAWLDVARNERTAVFGDLDRDGDIDMITAGVNLPLRVLRNDGASGHWLIVEPTESPYGCRVEVETPEGIQRRWIASGLGYLSASARYAHFGLGDHAGSVDVTVTWLDGRRVEGVGVGVDAHVRIEPPEK